MHDKVASGAWYRWPLHTLGFCLSAYAGWEIIVNGQGDAKVVGLIFLFGLPAILLSHAVEAIRRHAIAEEVQADAGHAWEHFASERRIAAPGLLFADARKAARARGGGNRHLPAQAVDDIFRADDTIIIWANRTAALVGAQAGLDVDDLRGQLVELAKFTKPRVGEGALEFTRRARARIVQLKTSLKDDDAFAIRRPGEMVPAWIARTAPVFLAVDAGQSVEDLIPALIEIAELAHPPASDENAMEWINEVLATAASTG